MIVGIAMFLAGALAGSVITYVVMRIRVNALDLDCASLPRSGYGTPSSNDLRDVESDS